MTNQSSTLTPKKCNPPGTGQFLTEASHLSASSAGNKAATVWGSRQLNPHRAAAIEEYSGSSFVDVGCGNGRYVTHFAARHRTAGLDIQEFPQWTETPEKFQIGDACDLPFEDASFETIVSFETLEHVPEVKSALNEFHRVCTGNIIVSVPNCELPSAMEASRMTFFHYTDRSHVNFFTRETLAATLMESGFQPLELKLINACSIQPLLNDLFGFPPLLARLLGRLAKQDAFPMTILAIANRR